MPKITRKSFIKFSPTYFFTITKRAGHVTIDDINSRWLDNYALNPDHEGAIVAVMPECWSHAYCGCTAFPWEVDTIGDDPHGEFTSSMEDGQTWAEGALCHQVLSHICICHPIHDIVTHLPFSIPDLLRINTFTTKVALEISNDTTQSGIRSIEKGYRQWKTDADIDPRSIAYLPDC